MDRSANESRNFSNNRYNNDRCNAACLPNPRADPPTCPCGHNGSEENPGPSHTVPNGVSGFLTISGPGGEVDK